VCAAFADEDAHHLYVSPDEVLAAVNARTRIWLSAMSADQEIDLRASTADTAASVSARAVRSAVNVHATTTSSSTVSTTMTRQSRDRRFTSRRSQLLNSTC